LRAPRDFPPFPTRARHNTTLTDEYLRAAQILGCGVEAIEQLAINAVRASLLPESSRVEMERRFREEFARRRMGAE
jgi:adenosine deaminase